MMLSSLLFNTGISIHFVIKIDICFSIVTVEIMVIWNNRTVIQYILLRECWYWSISRPVLHAFVSAVSHLEVNATAGVTSFLQSRRRGNVIYI